jgi:hypothetical protein
MPIASTYFSESFSSSFSPLLSLVYVSASSHLMNNAELEEILKKSRENNARLGLTGMLLYYEGAFMQVLEGSEDPVRGLYTRLGQDPRHHLITLLLEEYIPERNFPDWSMGYHRLQSDEVTQLEGFTSFVEADQFLAYFKDVPQKSLKLLQSFRKTSKR